MNLEEATNRYWTYSQHLRRGLLNTNDQQNFLTFTVKPVIANSQPPLSTLLGRLVA